MEHNCLLLRGEFARPCFQSICVEEKKRKGSTVSALAKSRKPGGNQDENRVGDNNKPTNSPGQDISGGSIEAK